MYTFVNILYSVNKELNWIEFCSFFVVSLIYDLNVGTFETVRPHNKTKKYNLTDSYANLDPTISGISLAKFKKSDGAL